MSQDSVELSAEKDMEVINVTDPGGFSIQDCKIATDNNHYKFYPPPSCPPGNYQQNYQKSESEKGDRYCITYQRPGPNFLHPSEIKIPHLVTC